MLIMEALVVLTAAMAADSSPTCSIYCDALYAGRNTPLPMNCDCNSLVVASQEKNLTPYRFKRQDYRSFSFNSLLNMLFPEQKRHRRNTYINNNDNHVPSTISNYTFNNKSKNDDIRFDKENKNTNYESQDKLNEPNEDVPDDTDYLSNCIHLHLTVFERKGNDDRELKINRKPDGKNIDKIFSDVQFIEQMNENCNDAIKVINENIKEIISIWKTANGTKFKNLHNSSVKIDNLTKVTYNISAETIQLVQAVTTIFNKKVLNLVTDFRNSTHDNISSNDQSTEPYSSTSPFARKYYNFTTKAILLNDKTNIKTIPPSKAVTDNIALVNKPNFNILTSENKNIMSDNNYDIFNGFKPLFNKSTTTEYSSLTIQNADKVTNNKGTLIPSVKQSSLQNQSFKKFKDTNNITTETNEIKRNNTEDIVRNIGINKTTAPDSQSTSITLLESTITPYIPVSKNPNIILSNNNKQEYDNKKKRKQHIRQQYNESEIPIMKVISREYSNDSVSSIINGTEILPNEDFKDTGIGMQSKANLYKIYQVYIPTPSPNLITLKAKAKSKNRNIYGKLYFLNRKEKIPAKFFQESDGSLQLGLDLFDICNKTNKENITQSNLLSRLCNCMKLNN